MKNLFLALAFLFVGSVGYAFSSELDMSINSNVIELNESSKKLNSKHVELELNKNFIFSKFNDFADDNWIYFRTRCFLVWVWIVGDDIYVSEPVEVPCDVEEFKIESEEIESE